MHGLNQRWEHANTVEAGQQPPQEGTYSSASFSSYDQPEAQLIVVRPCTWISISGRSWCLTFRAENEVQKHRAWAGRREAKLGRENAKDS